MNNNFDDGYGKALSYYPTVLEKMPYTETINKKQVEHKSECHSGTIEILREKRILSEIDMAIVNLLYRYQYLNYYNIEFYMKNISGLKNKDDYESNLCRLRKHGIVILLASQDKSVSMRYYTLSGGAMIYMAALHGKQYFPPKDGIRIPDLSKLLRIVSVNQLLLRIKNSYKKVHIEINKKFPEESFTVDAVVTILSKHAFIRNGNISIFIHSVRRYNDWEKELIPKLRKYVKCMEKLSESSPVFVVLAEDYRHIFRIAELCFKNFPEVLDILLFMNDLRIYKSDELKGELFDKFYACSYDQVGNSLHTESKRLII